MVEKSIIIIGAGTAGLSAGCYAQMNGYRTRIFEMHSVPGGLCTSWKRGDYTFDGCLHWLVGSRTGSMHRFFEELGAVQDRRMVDHEEFLRVEGSEGKTWIVYSDLDRLERHMKELSPSDARVIEELCAAARRFARYELSSEKPMELMGLRDKIAMLRLLPLFRTMRKYGGISTRQFASRFSDPLLREGFLLILDDLPGSTMIGPLVALGNLHARNAGWPIGGSLEFSRSIERRYIAMGGDIHYGSRVAEILVEDDRAVGIRLADGSEHPADVVISAADGRTTIFDMLKGRYINDRIRSYYEEWPIYQPQLLVSLGVARDFSTEPQSVKFPVEKPISIGGKAEHWLHMRHFCHDSTMAPPGKSVVTVAFLNNSYEYWRELHGDRERYKAEKEALAAAVLNRLEARFPGIGEQVEVVDVATPVTFERYTGNWQGSYMGWAMTDKTMGQTMGRTLPGLGEFYMAGQWIFMEAGVPGAVMSGRHVAQIICGKDSKKFVTTTP